MNRLSAIFLSAVRGELLRLLFGLRSDRMYLSELERITNFANRSIELELKKLLALQLLTATRDGNRIYYAANRDHPLYSDLRSIVLKTVGLHDVFHDALASNARIEYAFVFGSIAQSSERPDSDVDLMVIGDLGQRALATMLKGTSERIGREINPHIFSLHELARRISTRDHFLRDVLNKPKLFIKGEENEFTDLVRRQMAASSPDKP